MKGAAENTTISEQLREFRRSWRKAWDAVKNLNPTRVRLLQAIYRRLGENLYTSAGQEKLAEDIGVSARTVARHLQGLEADGWIKRKERITSNGRTTDLTYIAVAGRRDFFCVEPRQNVRGDLTKCQGKKGSAKKASELRSEAASAGAKRAATQAAPKGNVVPILAYVRQILALWRELVGEDVEPPRAERLNDYRDDELRTAFSLLLRRIATGKVHRPAGLYLHLLEATHSGEREPRRFSDDELRRIAGGVLPEHSRGVRKKPNEAAAIIDPHGGRYEETQPEQAPEPPPEEKAPPVAPPPAPPTVYDAPLATASRLGDVAAELVRLASSSARESGGSLWDALMDAARAASRVLGVDTVSTHMVLNELAASGVS